MRFLTLTTIAVAVLASVSALPVDSVRDISQTREDIPLSKRAEQLEPSAGAHLPVPGNGQNNGVGATNDVNLEGTPQEKAPLSKRNKKSKDATGKKNGGGATNPDGTPQEPGSLSKRNKEAKDAAATGQKNGATSGVNPDDAPQGTGFLSKRNKKSKDAAASQKNGGGATNPDDAPQGTKSLSKRTKNEKDGAASQKNGGGATNDGNVGGTYQDPNALSKRAEALSSGTAVVSGQDGGSQNTGTSPDDGPTEQLRGEYGPDGGM